MKYDSQFEEMKSSRPDEHLRYYEVAFERKGFPFPFSSHSLSGSMFPYPNVQDSLPTYEVAKYSFEGEEEEGLKSNQDWNCWRCLTPEAIVRRQTIPPQNPHFLAQHHFLSGQLHSVLLPAG
mgnify:CR=1 FL=1